MVKNTTAPLKYSPYRFWSLLAGAFWVLGIGALYIFRFPFVWAWFLVTNLITLIAFGVDKIQAKRRGGRIPELVLHSLELLGGTPAGFMGQHLFKHKRKKGKYLFWFWTIVAIQVALITLWLRHAGI